MLVPVEDPEIYRQIPKGLIVYKEFLKEDEEKTITEFMLEEFKSGKSERPDE